MSLSHRLFLFFLLFFCSGSAYADLITIPLTGGADIGEYTLFLELGTPPWSYNLRVDTGMPALYIPSQCFATSDGHHCRTTHYPTNSTSFVYIPCTPPCLCSQPGVNTSKCGFKEEFRNGIVVSGTLVKDTINFYDNKTISNITFAVFNSLLPSLIGSTANGLLGLSAWQTGFSNLNFLQQIAPTVGTSDFSLCLGEFGGQLVLGGYDPLYAGSNISYVPLIENTGSTNFTVELTDFKISGRSVWDSLWFNADQVTEVERECGNCTYATVDSGIQYLMLPEGAYGAVKSLFQQQLCRDHNTGPIGMCGEKNFFTGECFILDDSTIETYPTIELTLADGAVSLTIPPSNYFIDDLGESCLALGRISGDSVIIGNRIIQEYYTIFEPNNARIGFAKAVNCSGAQYRAEAVSGNGQYGVVGKKLAKPFVIRVVRINDSTPVEGITVTFNVVDVQPAEEVMWISQAIWNAKPAKVDPAMVVTDENGEAETYLWLEGAADENAVTADIPLCLNHVIFTATGEQSFLWGMLQYFILAVLIAIVIVLHIWYNKTVKKRKIQRFNSVLNISTSRLFRSPSEDALSDPVESPPLSPSLSPPGLRDRSINREEYDDEDEDPFQSAQPRTWFQNMQRKMKFEMWRFSKIMKRDR